MKSLSDQLSELLGADDKVPPIITAQEVGAPPFIIFRYGGMGLFNQRMVPLINLEYFSGYSNEDKPDGNIEKDMEYIVERIQYTGIQGVATAVLPFKGEKVGDSTYKYDGATLVIQGVCGV